MRNTHILGPRLSPRLHARDPRLLINSRHTTKSDTSIFNKRKYNMVRLCMINPHGASWVPNKANYAKALQGIHWIYRDYYTHALYVDVYIDHGDLHICYWCFQGLFAQIPALSDRNLSTITRYTVRVNVIWDCVYIKKAPLALLRFASQAFVKSSIYAILCFHKYVYKSFRRQIDSHIGQAVKENDFSL